MQVHGGTTPDDIIKRIRSAQTTAISNKEKYGVDTILFFDEVNTTDAIALVKEIMCDGRAQGRPINVADGALKIVAACNPYRRCVYFNFIFGKIMSLMKHVLINELNVLS